MGREGSPAEILSDSQLAAEQDPARIEFEDHPQDECGVFGIWAPGQGVLPKTIQGMEGLQHRGHSGAGIAYEITTAIPANGADKPVVIHKGLGRVREAIPEIYRPGEETWEFNLNRFDQLVGSPAAIGHTRYSTAESEDSDALHPHRFKKTGGALAHNGEVINMLDVAWDFDVDITEAPSDTGALTMVIDAQAERRDGDVVGAMHDVLPKVDGAYCLVVLDKGRLIAARDPWGWHPLALGTLPDGKGYVVASEQVVFQEVGAEFVRNIHPGEIVTIDEEGVRSSFIRRVEERMFCGYEGIYTAREDGVVEDIVVREWRRNMGRFHAKDHPPQEGSIVVPVPATGVPFAEGYAEEGRRPLVMAIEKRKGAPRTFQMRGDKRADAINGKYIFHDEFIVGQDIELGDDSTIKGHTHRAIVGELLKRGARSVRVRLSGWRYMNPCYMGMDTHERRNLIAANKTDDEIAYELKAAEITFNTPERVQQAADRAHVAGKAGRLCTACYTGIYPFRIPDGTTFMGMPLTRVAVELGSAAVLEQV